MLKKECKAEVGKEVGTDVEVEKKEGTEVANSVLKATNEECEVKDSANQEEAA